MPKTKASARRKARLLLKLHPDRDIQIIEHTKVRTGSDFRFNFRFPAKKGKTNKIILTKEY